VERNVWRKSGRSGSNGQCTEVLYTGELVLVRDSKDRTGPVLTFTPEEWQAFLDGVRRREFDL
jgi:predicted secreted Zn-dependent protease